MQTEHDLIIAGAGLSGLCLAFALKDTPLKMALVEATPRIQLQQSPAGDRALALAAGTVAELTALGIWQGISHKATPIRHIHISDRGHFGKTRLSAEQEQVAALGYVITARDLETHVSDLVSQAGIPCYCPTRLVGIMSDLNDIHLSLKSDKASFTIAAKLLIGADGGNSSVRQLLDIPQQITDYQQTALVTTVSTRLPHHNTAYERFTASGPLALLPIDKKQCAVVWTRTRAEAEALMLGSEADFLAELQLNFGYRLGELSLISPRRAFPLALIRAQRMIATRTVIIGNAAHQLHPVAGQGFNLGLRDVIQLAQRLSDAQHQGIDIGDTHFLTSYAKARQADHQRIIGFTDSVVKIFSNDWLPVAATRNIGLTLLDHLPWAKSKLAQQAMGFIR